MVNKFFLKNVLNALSYSKLYFMLFYATLDYYKLYPISLKNIIGYSTWIYPNLLYAFYFKLYKTKLFNYP
jgi:hypothetical protein